MKKLKKILFCLLHIVLIVAGVTIGAYLVSLFIPKIRTEGRLPTYIAGTCFGIFLYRITTYIKEKGKNSES